MWALMDTKARGMRRTCAKQVSLLVVNSHLYPVTIYKLKANPFFSDNWKLVTCYV